MWNALDSTSSHTSHSNAPTKRVYLVAISPDGSRIAAAGGNKAIYMFNTHNGTSTLQPLVAHTDTIFSVAFSLNGSRHVVSALTDKTIRMWDVNEETLTPTDLVGMHNKEVFSAAFSPDGKHIASGYDERKIWMWELQMLSLVFDLFGLQHHEGCIWLVL
ncbi:thiol-dependent ubiquitin-specific protease, partial [Rhizoctonia solani]